MADGMFAEMSGEIDNTMSQADLEAAYEAKEKACTANTACKAMTACLDKMDAPSGPPGDCSKGTADAGPTAAEKKKALIDAAKKVVDDAKKTKDKAQTAVTTACGSRRSARDTHVAARTLCNDACEAAGTTVQVCKDGCQTAFELAETTTTTTESAACTAARKDLKDAEDAQTKAEAAVEDADSDSDSAATAAASVLAMAVAAAATFV
jgi:hypothetical protein